MRTPTLVLAVLLLVSCGDDNPTNGDTANVEGVWTASLSDMTGSGVSCSSTIPTTLAITQDGTDFSGTYSGGELTCTEPGGTSSIPVEPGEIVNGRVNGEEVDFDLDTPDFHLTGIADGDAIFGRAHWTVDDGTGAMTLSGDWSATR